MSEIEIDHRPKVYDDPEYCENINGFECMFLFDCIDGECQMCVMFDRKELEAEIVDRFPLFKKCEECKTAYQKALGVK